MLLAQKVENLWEARWTLGSEDRGDSWGRRWEQDHDWNITIGNMIIWNILALPGRYSLSRFLGF